MKRILPMLLLGIMIMAGLRGNAAVLVPIDHITDPDSLTSASVSTPHTLIDKDKDNTKVTSPAKPKPAKAAYVPLATRQFEVLPKNRTVS